MKPTWLEHGLSTQVAAELLVTHGPNELSDSEQKSFWRTLISILTEPMFLMLIVAAGIYLLLGDLGEGLLLAAFALFSIGLVVVQERRSEHAVDALRALSSPQARVLRDGKTQHIPAREVVPGDALLLAEGERIAADAVVRSMSSLTVEEAVLTGESVPVRKASLDMGVAPTVKVAGGDDLPSVFAGTLVVSGHGVAEVTATGTHTQIGLIGSSLASIQSEATLLEKSIKKFVRIFAGFAVVASTCLVLWYGLQQHDWLKGMLSGIAFAMAMLPEEFPMALTVFLALGAWRLAQIKVLARRPAVIETLGAATILCVDKTGTLTENKMRVAALFAEDKTVDIGKEIATLPEAFHRVLEHAVLASRRTGVDPMDQAICTLGEKVLSSTEHLHPAWQLEQDYELTPQLLAMSRAWVMEDGQSAVAAKGAPEAITDLCHLDSASTEKVMNGVRELAARGLRVIAVASSRYKSPDLPTSQHDFNFSFEGLIGLEDPLRVTVAPAVAQAHAAGIKVAMITGDYPATALAIARQAGIDTSGGVLTGDELTSMDAAALSAALLKVRVFARVMPTQKLRLVESLKASGEIVAMTGDGVNDAPALKAAHIGIAMGERGTDVAREAASIILLDEDFSRIVGAVHMGRRIFENLRKVMTYITAIHVPIAGLALLPILMGLPPLMLPVHVALLEMLIDPMCSIAFESVPPDPDLMSRPPRAATDLIIGGPLLLTGLIQGIGALFATMVVYWFSLHIELAEDQARTLAIACLMSANVTLVFLNSSMGVVTRRWFSASYKVFWFILAGAGLALATAIAIPAMRTLLHFSVPSMSDLAAAMVLGFVSVLVFAKAKNYMSKPEVG